MKNGSVLVLCLAVFTAMGLLTGCFRGPGPETAMLEEALFTDDDVLSATDSSGEFNSVEPGETKSLEDATELDLELPEELDAEISTQGIQAEAAGYITFLQTGKNNAGKDAVSVWLSDQSTGERVRVYYTVTGDVTSATVTADGNTVYFTGRPAGETQYDIYRLDIAADTATNETSDAGFDDNVTVSADGGVLSWEHRALTEGQVAANESTARAEVRFKDSSTNATTSIRTKYHNVTPSVSADGGYIAFALPSGAGDANYSADFLNKNDAIRFYEIATKEQAGVRASSRSLFDPSISNNASKVAWMEVAEDGIERLRIRDITANTISVGARSNGTIDLKTGAITADPNYLVVEEYIGSSERSRVRTRNLTTGKFESAAAADTTKDRFFEEAFWQLPLEHDDNGEGEQDPVETGEVITSAGGEIALGDGTKAAVPGGFLSSQANIELSTSNIRNTNFPQSYEVLEPRSTLSPIALSTSVSFSASSLNGAFLNKEAAPDLKLRIPSTVTYEGAGMAELRVFLDGEQVSFGLQQYRTAEAVGDEVSNVITFNAYDLSQIIGDKNPNTITLTAHPVGVKRFLNGGDAPEIGTLDITEKYGATSNIDVVYEGLYRVTEDFDPNAELPKTIGGDDVGPARTYDRLPPGIVEARALDVNDRKQPLVLVHGFDGKLAGFAFTGVYAQSMPAVHGTGNSTWVKALMKDSAITEKYDIYLFGYDMSQSIGNSGALLESNKREVFGSDPVAFASYSMGSSVVHDYLQRNSANLEETVDWVAVGSGLEGSPGLLCRERKFGLCTFSEINKEAFTGSFGILGELAKATDPDAVEASEDLLQFYAGWLLEYPSLYDMTWQYGGQAGAPFVNNPYNSVLNADVNYPNFTSIFSTTPGGEGFLDGSWKRINPALGGDTDGLFSCSSQTLSGGNDCPNNSVFGYTVDMTGEASHTNFPAVAIENLKASLLRDGDDEEEDPPCGVLCAPSPEPRIEVPDTLPILEGKGRTRSFEIENTGEATLKFEATSSYLLLGCFGDDEEDEALTADDIPGGEYGRVYEINPKLGAVPPGSSVTVTLTIREETIATNRLCAKIFINSNDPVRPKVAVDSELNLSF